MSRQPTRHQPGPGPSRHSSPPPSTQQSHLTSPSRLRVQGWDPILIISQIVTIQTLHYLILSLLIPPLLSIFADPLSLDYEGGPSSVAMVMDWREMAGAATFEGSLAGSYTRLPEGLGRKPGGYRIGHPAASNVRDSPEVAGKGGVLDHAAAMVGMSDTKPVGGPGGIGSSPGVISGKGDELREVLASTISEGGPSELGADPMRGWVLGFTWLISSTLDVFPLYFFVRKPTHILDFSLTLSFNHLLLTTYYASSFPTSLWWWIVMAVGAAIQTVWAEQMCVRREMREGWEGFAGSGGDDRDRDRDRRAGERGVGNARATEEEMELGAIRGKGNGKGDYERLATHER